MHGGVGGRREPDAIARLSAVRDAILMLVTRMRWRYRDGETKWEEET